jgi:hypothetical protein
VLVSSPSAVPDRILFDAPVPPEVRIEVATRLVPLADAGYHVRVNVPEQGTEHLGWRVLLDAPGRHASFRIRTDADSAEWDAAIHELVRPSH